MKGAGTSWPPVSDDDFVERLIPAVQAAIVAVSSGSADRDRNDHLPIDAPNVANALLMILATLLEPAPDCRTPQGIRLTGDAAGRELAQLIRETRRLKLVEAMDPGTVQ